ncbi:10791_t:CDS:2 [Acaulospora colombiana]|uniref:10791_t:CDS:1 n=1 Tax=Acaulospora colombiana TaxID=27376 RepID=A0ACA9JZM3_9GLOM|nr:10791_t:CDS:2 [Acaulospora colombiana]
MTSKFPIDFTPSYLINTPIGEYNKEYEHQPIRMPTILNKYDAFDLLEVSDNGLTVFYKGPGLFNAHAASIRANYSMPIEAGLYYFEVDIIDRGQHGYIGIGFGESNVSVNGLPGTAFTNVEGNLYPMIGLRSRGEIVEANFGQRPFKFNIDNYAQFIFKEVRKNEALRQWIDRIFGENDNNNIEVTTDGSSSSSEDSDE